MPIRSKTHVMVQREHSWRLELMAKLKKYIIEFDTDMQGHRRFVERKRFKPPGG